MDDKSQAALDILREDERFGWIVEQLNDSFAEGIAQSAKERGSLAQGDYMASSEASFSTRDRRKREKYETSRPYQESEKLELIRFAIHEVFVTLPKVRQANSSWLRELGSTATTIEFDAPDNEERTERSYVQSLAIDESTLADLQRRYEQFVENLVP